MYTSVLLLALGIALLSGNLVKYLLVVSLVMLFYFKSVYEEKYLDELPGGSDPARFIQDREIERDLIRPQLAGLAQRWLTLDSSRQRRGRIHHQ